LRAIQIISWFGYSFFAKSTGKLFKTHQSTREYLSYIVGGNIQGIDMLHKTISGKFHLLNSLYCALLVSTAHA
jgi:hypothetical protein